MGIERRFAFSMRGKAAELRRRADVGLRVPL